MGRFVTGEGFEWKFAFGTQDSSFGEVLEEILNDDDDNYVNRFVGTQNQGEQLELYIDDIKDLINIIKSYIGEDFKIIEWDKKDTYSSEEETRKGADKKYWDKLMMLKFQKYLEKENFCEEYLNFYVEY